MTGLVIRDEKERGYERESEISQEEEIERKDVGLSYQRGERQKES